MIELFLVPRVSTMKVFFLLAPSLFVRPSLLVLPPLTKLPFTASRTSSFPHTCMAHQTSRRYRDTLSVA